MTGHVSADPSPDAMILAARVIRAGAMPSGDVGAEAGGRGTHTPLIPDATLARAGIDRVAALLPLEVCHYDMDTSSRASRYTPCQ
jgi:hypothetical protein